MKIGLILPGFSASESDWCIPALLDLVRCLSCRTEIHVFSLRYPHHQQPYSVFGAAVHPLGGGVVRRGGRLRLLSRAVARIAAEHRRGAFDLLHAFWADEPGFVAVTAGALLRLPAIVSLAGGELVGFRDIGYGGQLHRTSRWLTAIALHRATRVTAGSRYVAERAGRAVAPGRLAVLPLGVDPRRFQPLSPPGERSPFEHGLLHILTVASLIPVKQPEMLLRALPEVAGGVPSIRVHLAGDGPLLDPLRANAAVLGVADRVCFHGAVPHADLPAFYRAANLCVLCSRHEAQGMVALEAAACGRTTVGTAVGILPDLSPDHVVAPDDPAGLARLLLRLASDPDLRTELGRRSRELATTRYALERTVADLLTTYRHLRAEIGQRG